MHLKKLGPIIDGNPAQIEQLVEIFNRPTPQRSTPRSVAPTPSAINSTNRDSSYYLNILSRYEMTATFAGLAAALFFVLWLITLVIFTGANALFGLLIVVCVIVAAISFTIGRVYDKKWSAARHEEQVIADRIEAENAKKAAQAQFEADRHKCIVELNEINTEARTTINAIHVLARSAEDNMQLAETEFNRRAFNPFWTAVEGAASQLGEISEKMQQYASYADRHTAKGKELATKYRSSAPAFAVTADNVKFLATAGDLSNRLDTIVRRADTDFEFANILNQRRTHTILIAGFNNLGSALAGLSAKISSDLASMASSVNSAITSAAANSSDQRDEMIRMLDNIQYRRLPGGFRRDY